VRSSSLPEAKRNGKLTFSDLTLARALQPQADRKELNVVVFGYYQLFFLAHDRQELQEGEIKASLEPKELSAKNAMLMNGLEDKS